MIKYFVVCDLREERKLSLLTTTVSWEVGSTSAISVSDRGVIRRGETHCCCFDVFHHEEGTTDTDANPDDDDDPAVLSQDVDVVVKK